MRNSILLLFIILCFSCKAKKEVEVSKKENTIGIVSVSKDRPVAMANWSFTKLKTEVPNEYIVEAKLQLAKHWHIFDFEPGGDGLLIAPEFNFDNSAILILKKEAEGELISDQISGMGNVRYYEDEVSFKVLVRSNTEVIKGSVYYQLCDEEKCMAPSEELFNLK